MKTRRHHNNKGYRQIQRGKTFSQLKRICRSIFGSFENEVTMADRFAKEAADEIDAGILAEVIALAKESENSC